MDFFLYSGPMERFSDLDFIRLIAAEKKSKNVTLILCTGGGSPDAAYKIGLYLQSRYDSVTVLVPGICKSAGTLLAICASTLAFLPYGELGPLDVQMSKQDNLMGQESGLNIIEALSTLEDRARETFHRTVVETVASSGGVVSFATAAHSATELVQSMYAPIFAQIDPEEVGSRSRAMRIGEDYGRRLNRKFNNLRDNGAMEGLSRSYPSHGFVIDILEANHLFNEVREANAVEKALVEHVGIKCRFPQSRLHIQCLNDELAALQESQNVNEDQKGEPESGDSGDSEESRAVNGADLEGANGAGKVSSSNKRTEARIGEAKT